MLQIRRCVLQAAITSCFFLGLSLPLMGASSPRMIDTADLPPLRVGDVLLLDLGCYACKMISATTLSPFNHSGLVLAFADDGTPLIAQSLGTTETVSLATFLAQAKSPSHAMVRRPLELAQKFDKNPAAYVELTRRMARHFEAFFQGQPFDDAFLWDNVDEQGRDILYCSEMVQKTLNHVLSRKLSTILMDFSPHWDFWRRYFHGAVPQGLPGNSPASLAESPLLSTLWERHAP